MPNYSLSIPPWGLLATPEDDDECAIREEWDTARDALLEAQRRLDMAADAWETWRQDREADPVATPENVVLALLDLGNDACTGICGPTDVEIYLPTGRILLAKDFNTTGWEAVFEVLVNEEQVPLVDGPGSNSATVTEVVEWAEALIRDWTAHVA